MGFQSEEAPRGVWVATSIAERIQGFKDTLHHYDNVGLVAEVSGGSHRISAHRATRDLLEAHPRLTGRGSGAQDGGSETNGSGSRLK